MLIFNGRDLAAKNKEVIFGILAVAAENKVLLLAKFFGGRRHRPCFWRFLAAENGFRSCSGLEELMSHTQARAGDWEDKARVKICAAGEVLFACRRIGRGDWDLLDDCFLTFS